MLCGRSVTVTRAFSSLSKTELIKHHLQKRFPLFCSDYERGSLRSLLTPGVQGFALRMCHVAGNIWSSALLRMFMSPGEILKNHWSPFNHESWISPVYQIILLPGQKDTVRRIKPPVSENLDGRASLLDTASVITIVVDEGMQWDTNRP